MNQLLDQLKQFWTGFTGKQRALLLGGAAVTIAVLLVFVKLIGSPDYKPLVSGLEPSDAQALVAELSAKNIPHQLSADGKSISVPADQVDAARMEIASQGMPHSGRMGFELFDKMSWGQTEFDEKVNYQRALEGELERTIQTLRDVESARVHLVMATQSVFVDREREAKASVILKLRRGSISDDTQQAITHLVAGAVDNLKPENVSVIDAETNRPLGVSRHHSDTGSDVEQELSNRLLATLEPVVGAQSVHASVNVEYDPSTSEENEEKYDPNTAVAVSMQRTEEQIGSGSAVGGIPGTSSNVPTVKQTAQAINTADADSGAQRSKSETGTYAVNKYQKHTLNPAGRIRRITAALIVDDAVDVVDKNGKKSEERRKRTPEEMKQIEALAKNAIGLDEDRGDAVTVENLSFQKREVAEVLTPPTKLGKLRNTLNDWSTLVRYGALLVLFLLAYVLMLRPIKKHAMASLKDGGTRKSGEALPGVDATAAAELARGNDETELKKQLVERLKKEPATTSRLVQALLREEEA